MTTLERLRDVLTTLRTWARPLAFGGGVSQVRQPEMPAGVASSLQADLEIVEFELQVAEDVVARLTRERDDALAVAQDKREDLGYSWVPELVEWLGACDGNSPPCTWCRADVYGHGPRRHDRLCRAAAWARRIGGIAETARQVDAAWDAALVEDRLLRMNPVLVMPAGATIERMGSGEALVMRPADFQLHPTFDAISCGACGRPGLGCVCPSPTAQAAPRQPLVHQGSNDPRRWACGVEKAADLSDSHAGAWVNCADCRVVLGLDVRR